MVQQTYWSTRCCMAWLLSLSFFFRCWFTLSFYKHEKEKKEPLQQRWCFVGDAVVVVGCLTRSEPITSPRSSRTLSAPAAAAAVFWSKRKINQEQQQVLYAVPFYFSSSFFPVSLKYINGTPTIIDSDSSVFVVVVAVAVRSSLDTFHSSIMRFPSL